MANTANFMRTGGSSTPMISVRDDRGAPITELDLPETVQEPADADSQLRDAGWTRSADWTATDQGWVAPVVPS